MKNQTLKKFIELATSNEGNGWTRTKKEIAPKSVTKEEKRELIEGGVAALFTYSEWSEPHALRLTEKGEKMATANGVRFGWWNAECQACN